MLETRVKKIEQAKGFGRFVIEPLEQGFGHTLGSALRRVLLAHLGGAAVTSVKIAGAPHEFSTLPGVREDVVELILNFKKVQFAMERKQPTIVTLDTIGPGEVTAANLECPAGIEVVNKDEYLASLADKKTKLVAEILVEYSKGYHLRLEGDHKVGEIPVDANFSPVHRVNYQVEETRLGRVTDLDKLVLSVWTRGSVLPDDALKQAAAVLVNQFQLIQADAELEDLIEDKISSLQGQSKVKTKEERVYLEELGLPTRVVNTLKKGGFQDLQDLKNKERVELEKIKNIGPKTIDLIFTKIEERKA